MLLKSHSANHLPMARGTAVTYSKGAYLHHSASKHVSKNKLSFQMNTFSQRLSEIIYGALIKKQANYYRVFISLASSRIYCPLSDIRWFILVYSGFVPVLRKVLCHTELFFGIDRAQICFFSKVFWSGISEIANQLVLVFVRFVLRLVK